MSDDRDLSPLLAQVTALVAASGVPSFPAVPVAEGAPTAAWREEDVTGFFDLVNVVKPPLVYVQATRVDQAALDALTAAADERETALADAGLDDDVDNDDDDEEADDEDRFEFDALTDEYVGRDTARAELKQWRAAAAAASAHVGDVGRVDVAFAAGGVLHELDRSTDWYDDFELAQVEAITAGRRRRLTPRTPGGWRSERADKAQEARRLRDELDPTVKTWVEQLLASPKFVGGVSKEARFAGAGEVIPELEQWRTKSGDLWTDPQGWAQRQAARDAAFDAEQQLPTVKDARAADLRARASEVARALLSDAEFRSLRTKDEQKRYIHSLVESRLWFKSTDVTDRVLTLVRDLIASGDTADRLNFD
jgi:hypothetical protein